MFHPATPHGRNTIHVIDVCISNALKLTLKIYTFISTHYQDLSTTVLGTLVKLLRIVLHLLLIVVCYKINNLSFFWGFTMLKKCIK